MLYEIVPFIRCGPVDWTMTFDEVAAVLGPPERVGRNRAGNRIEFRSDQALSFIFEQSTGKLIEVSCLNQSPGLTLSGVLLNQSDSESVVSMLLKLDGTAFQGFGSIVFPNLGVALTGYIPEDVEIRAASAYAQGRWDAVFASMKRFRYGPPKA